MVENLVREPYGNTNKMSKILPIIILLILVAVFIYAIFLILSWVIYIFTGLPKEILAACVTAFGTVIGAVIVTVIGKIIEKRFEIEGELREKKAILYEGFMDFFLKTVGSETLGGEKSDEKALIDYFFNMTPKMIAFGSDDIVRRWSYLKRKWSNPEGYLAENMMWDIEDLWIAMRNDIGHKNKNIKRGDILRLFVNDIDSFLEKKMK
jgi:hypothetical protein